MRLFIVIVWLIIPGLTVLRAQMPLSNEQVIENLLFKALDSLEIIQSGPEFKFKFETLNDEQKAFCKSRLIKYFGSKGFKAQTDSAAKILVIQEFRPKIKYFESIGQLVGAGKMIRREVRLKLSAYLDGRQPVYAKKYWQVEMIHKDKIDRTKVQKIEQSPFTFTHGKWESFSRWTRFLQPVIIIGSISVLIYLFYSLRT